MKTPTYSCTTSWQCCPNILILQSQRKQVEKQYLHSQTKHYMKLSSKLPHFLLLINADIQTRTETPQFCDYSLISNQLPYQLGLCLLEHTRILSALKVCWWRAYPVVISLLTVRRCSPSCHSCYRSVIRTTCTDGCDPVYYSQSSFCLPFLELVSAQLCLFIQPTTSSQPMYNQL